MESDAMARPFFSEPRQLATGSSTQCDWFVGNSCELKFWGEKALDG